MKKKILIPILTGAATILAITPVVSLTSCGNTNPQPTPADSFMWVLDKSARTACIYRFIGSETEITIPTEYTDPSSGLVYSVTSIGEYAFTECTGLTSITIPNSVTTIENYAFQLCTGLTSITIPNSVTSIGMNAFIECTGLTSVSIGSGVTSIGYSAFSQCTGLSSIKVDANNQIYTSQDSDGNECNCIIKKQNKELITGCKTTSIPNSVTSIGDSAFEGCTGLTSITIPNSVTSIGYFAFSQCTGLSSIKVDANNQIYTSQDSDGNECNCIIKKQNKELITGCKTTSIPNSVTSIGDSAFLGCTGLTSITIPNSVTSIGVGAFEGCTGLTSITIPNSVTSIGGMAFQLCIGLTSISYSGTKSQFAQISTGDNWHTGVPATVVHCTDGDVALADI